MEAPSPADSHNRRIRMVHPNPVASAVGARIINSYVTMKSSKLVILSIALFTVVTSAHPQALDQSGANLIRPGESIGRTHIGRKGGFDLKNVPQPGFHSIEVDGVLMKYIYNVIDHPIILFC
jgi:hypothetical protein